MSAIRLDPSAPDLADAAPAERDLLSWLGYRIGHGGHDLRTPASFAAATTTLSASIRTGPL